MHKEESIQKVEQWFIVRNLHTLDGSGQLKKLEEEILELQKAYVERKVLEEIDAVGDIAVVLIGYCMQRGFDDCSEIFKLPYVVNKKCNSVRDAIFDLLFDRVDLVNAFENNGAETEKHIIKRMIGLLFAYCDYRAFDFWECLESAYNEIRDRKGKVIGEVFVKEADL